MYHTKLLASLAALLLALSGSGQSKVFILSQPARPLIEVAENKQVINSDFLVQNKTGDTITLTKILLKVYDKSNRLVHSRFLDNNGTAPSIRSIEDRVLPDSSVRLIFNPFTDFNLSTPLHRLLFEWTFEHNDGAETKLRSESMPITYVQKEQFFFPLAGKVLVYDAHDLNAHHRRFNFEFAPIKALGFSANFMRYAYDFVILDANGNSTSEDKPDSTHPGWHKPVFAIAGGTVIYATSNQKDDHKFDIPALSTDPMALYGNCVAIRHSSGAVSVYGHLSENSVGVRVGDQVTARQKIGSIGASGSSFFPHLHFEVRNSLLHAAEGLPSYFSNLLLIEGDKKTRLRSGQAETGYIVEAN